MASRFFTPALIFHAMPLLRHLRGFSVFILLFLLKTECKWMFRIFLNKMNKINTLNPLKCLSRGMAWAYHITGHWNTLFMSLPVLSVPLSIWWNTAQASSTKTPLCQAWSPARGGPSTLPWTESCARFTVWTSRLRAWKTTGNTVSTGPLVFCADVSSLVLCFLDLDGIKVLMHQPLLIVSWAC